MAVKLETQTNQIYISPAESKKLALILFEEKLSANVNLFLLAELRGIQKKMEANDLSKISEIIIEHFRKNKKLPADTMFEETLKEINDALADFAHKGRKSWLGKFSALVAIKSERDLYMANSGHTCAWLKRKNSLNEVLGQDKTEVHPLKTFLNFSSGRLTDGDSVIMATSAIFNYVSVELFSKTLNSNPLDVCCDKISEILKSSAKSDEGFAVFMVGMAKKVATEPEIIPQPAAVMENVTAEPAKVSLKKKAVAKTPVLVESITRSMDGPIYAPTPEDMKAEAQSLPKEKFKLKIPALKFPKLSFPKISFKVPGFGFLSNVSGPAKFFFGSFILFIVLFALNIAAFGVRKSHAKQVEQFNTTSASLVDMLEQAESSLIYKNQSQAMKLMSSAESELHKLEQLDSGKAVPFQAKFEEMNNKVNRVTILRNLTPVFEMQYPTSFVARAGSGYLIANENPNSLGLFTDNKLTNIFMLNSTDGQIKGVAHVSGQGNFVVSKDKFYFVNQSSKEFEQVNYISNGDLSALKFVGPNRLFAINKNTNQVIRMNASSSSISAGLNMLKSNVDLKDAQDLGIDSDMFILLSDSVLKFSASGTQQDFMLAPTSEPAKNMKKIRVGNQLYILEPISKRVMIYSRKGDLLNQVQFPELTDLRDLYVDEGTHEMFLFNSNKAYRITF